MPRSNKPGWIDWVNSAAREIILEDLLPNGFLFGKNDMPASVAWEHYRQMPEFKSPTVVYDQFEARLKDHRKQASKRFEISKKEKEMMQHDRKIYPTQYRNQRGEVVFSRHPAQKHLRADVAANCHKLMTRSQLYTSRPEYQEFKLSYFSRRIDQEIRRHKFSTHLEQKRVKQRRQHAEEVVKRKLQEESKKQKMKEKIAKMKEQEDLKKRREEVKKQKMTEKAARQKQKEEAMAAKKRKQDEAKKQKMAVKKRKIAKKSTTINDQKEPKKEKTALKRRLSEKSTRKKEAKKKRIV